MIEQFEKKEIKECSFKFFHETTHEDYSVGVCLKNIGITPYFTRDHQNRELFMVKKK